MNPCDESNDYNCYNNYDGLGFDTKNDCLDEYNCGEPDITECPDNITEYREFNLESCGRKGWGQNNNDCWLDSAMYALFGTTDLSKKSSHTLNKINEVTPELGLALRNYLIGLERDDWDKGTIGGRFSRGDLCKQDWKNKITKLIIGYAETVFGNAAASANFQEVAGNYSNGDMSLLFKIFAHMDSENVEYFSTDNFDMVCSKPSDKDSYMEDIDIDDGVKKLKIKQRKFIKNILMKLSNEYIGKEYFFIDIRGLDISCNDMTRIVECYGLKDNSGNTYNLTSICYGKGIHYTASVKCNDRWYLYDNQSPNLVSQIDSKRIHDYSPFYDSEQLVLVFNKEIGKVKKEKKMSTKVRPTSPRVRRPTSPRVSRPTSPRVSRQASSQVSRQASSKVIRQASSKVSRQASSKVSRPTSPKVSKQARTQVSRRAQRRF